MINPRPLPPSPSFRWASPVLWNDDIRNYRQALVTHVCEQAMTDEARENIRAAMVMCGMEAQADE